MNKPTNILIDQAFHDKFDAFETSFQPGDWDNMKSLLESDSLPLILPPDKHIFTNLKNITIMILITTLTAGMMLVATPQEAIQSITIKPTPSVITNTIAQSDVEVLSNTQETTTSDQLMVDAFNKQADININYFIESLTKPIKQGLQLLPNENEISMLSQAEFSGMSQEDEITAPDSAKFMKVVTSRYWVDTTYRYIHYKPSRDIEEGWIGIYFTDQTMTNANQWQQIGRHSRTLGFNIQAMSGNILPGENLAIYGGLDWGMQFYGRSDKSEVLINSVNEDRGLTYLRSHSNDIFLSGQIEWAKARIVPYVTGSIGTRIFTTGQTTRALLGSSEYESTQDNGVFTRGAIAAKVGFGLKLKLTPHIYFDARYEYTESGSFRTVDYKNSAFNGLDYDLGFKRLNINAEQFRFGFVFDIGGDNYEKVVDEPGHWEETTQTLYVDPIDSTKVFVPCPCDKPKTKRRSSNRNNYPDMPQENQGKKRFPGSEGGIFTPGSGSGSGKGDFPGIKKPPVRW